MKIEIDKDKAGQWFFHVRAKNGKILAHSESYTRKRNARKAAELIAAGGAEIVELA